VSTVVVTTVDTRSRAADRYGRMLWLSRKTLSGS
jgi:hypothetical protein